VDRTTHDQIQIDLPQVKPLVTRFRTESGYCPNCQKWVRSRHPEQLSQASGAAGVCLGPRAMALAADLKHRLGIPYRKITELLEITFGLEVTAGGLCQADARLPVCRQAGRIKLSPSTGNWWRRSGRAPRCTPMKPGGGSGP